MFATIGIAAASLVSAFGFWFAFGFARELIRLF